MRIRWVVLLAVIVSGAFPRPAAAVTIQDLVELTRAGLGDDVLVALVETSGAVYSLTTREIVDLKRAGVSERVIVVMLTQGRMGVAAPEVSSVDPLPALPPTTEVAVAPAATSTIVVVPAVVPYPVFLPGPSQHCVKTPAAPPATTSRGVGRFMNDGFRTGTLLASWGPIVPVCSPGRRK